MYVQTRILVQKKIDCVIARFVSTNYTNLYLYMYICCFMYKSEKTRTHLVHVLVPILGPNIRASNCFINIEHFSYNFYQCFLPYLLLSVRCTSYYLKFCLLGYFSNNSY